MEDKGRTHSIVVPDRWAFLEEQAKRVKDLRGAVAEVGVYKGGTARLLATTLAHKSIHLFDTFDGMPEVTEWDWHKKGDFADTSLASVKSYLQELDNVNLYPGLFPETAKDMTEDEFCLVHVDVDIYESTKAVVEYFWPLLVSGGVMVFDDYNVPTCQGTNKAVDEFFESRGLSVTVSGADKLCGTRIVKP
jgi:O-methyltransferase